MVGIVVLILTFLFIPESPRYYIAKGDIKNTFKVYKYLAKLHPNPEVKEKIRVLEKRQGEVKLEEDTSNDLPLKKQIQYFTKTKKRLVTCGIIALMWFINILQ